MLVVTCCCAIRYILKDCNLHNHCDKNLNSNLIQKIDVHTLNGGEIFFESCYFSYNIQKLFPLLT
jgi:hypothetical protein